MKPHRMRVTHTLLTAYGMLDKMDVLVSRPPSSRLLMLGRLGPLMMSTPRRVLISGIRG
jgi:hypothetical protein